MMQKTFQGAAATPFSQVLAGDVACVFRGARGELSSERVDAARIRCRVQRNHMEGL